MSTKVKEKEYIRWLGVASSIAILFIIVLIAKDENIDVWAAPVLVALGFLPAFVSVFTSLAKCFWPNLIIGLWFLFVGIMAATEASGHGYGKAGTSAMLLLLAALTLSSTPILNMIFGKKIDKGDNSVNSE